MLQVTQTTNRGNRTPQAADTPLGRRYVASVIEPRRESLRAAIKRGIGRGEIGADLDVRILADSLVGPVLLRRMLGELRRLPRNFADRLVDSVLRGWEVD